MSSRFDEAHEAIIGAVGGGATLEDAADEVGVPVQTVRTWLAKGRKDSAGVYGEFARRVGEGKSHRGDDVPMSDDEFELWLARLIRRGSAQGLKLYMEWRDKRYGDSDDEAPADPLAFADELAAKRAA